MGALRQLGSLFWKNYVIRKRHPGILLLEILWPVVIFILVGVLRTRIPPRHVDTCSYPERALPGDDLVPFLQSSVCTLDNVCKQPESISEDLTNQKRFQAMVADISPILTKNTTRNAVKALPTVQKVLQIARNITDGTDLNDLDDRLRLRNMFSDPNKMVSLLADKYKVLTPAAAEDLLDSSLNIVELLKTVGSVDFKGIVCNPDTLQKYLLFPRGVDIRQVSSSLCALNESLISNITNELVRMLDVPNMIRLAEDFASLMGAFDYAVLLEDLADMVELLQGRSSLASVFTDLSFLSLTPTAFRDLAKMIPILTSMEDIDFQSIEAVYDIFKPLLLTITNDDQAIEAVTEFLEAGNTLLQAFADPNTDWGEVIQNFLPLLNETENLIEENSTIYAILSAIPDVSGYFDMILNNETVAADSALTGLGQAQTDAVMRMMMGDEMMDSMMILGYGMMDMMDVMMDFFRGMDDSLRYSIETNSDMRGAMTTLNAVGPERTGELLLEIISVENVRNIYNGTTDVRTVCTEAANEVFVYLPADELSAITDSVCSETVTEVVTTSMSTESYDELQVSMEVIMKDMDLMLQGNMSLRENMTMENMNTRMTEMIVKVTDMLVNMTSNWDTTLMTVVPEWQMVYDTDWRNMWMGLSESYVKSNILVQLETSFRTLENTHLWNSVDKVFLMADALMATLREFMGIVGPFTGPDSTLYTFAAHIKYLPDVIEGFMKNTNVLAKILELENMDNITAIAGVMCEVNWADLNVSKEVPLDNIENLICKTDWMSFLETMLVKLHPFTFLKEIEEVYMDGYDSGINWSQMINNLDYHLSLLTNGEVMRYIDLWMGVDLGIENMGKTLQRILDYVMSMGAGETVTSNKESIVSGLESLDRQMGDMQSWNEIKHYIYVVVTYHKVLNRYLADARVSGFNATLYIKEVSPTLGDFILQSAASVPGLLDSVQYAMSNIYNTMNTLLVADFMDLCNSIDINQLLNLPNNDMVTKFKEDLCALNWTLIEEEFMTSDQNLQELGIALEKLNSNTTMEPIHLNWTDIVSTVEEFITLMEATVTSEQSFMWEALDLEAVNGSYSELAENIWNLPEYDASWWIQAMNRFTDLLFQQNDPSMDLLMNSLAASSFINYHINVFLNKQLEYFTSRSVVDLRAYMKSSEMDKVFDVLVKSPDVIKILRVNMINIMQNMDMGMLDSLGDAMDICNKSVDSLSSIEIPPDVTMTTTELQTLMCALELNVTKLMEELFISLDGMEELFENMELLNKENITAKDLYIEVDRVEAASNMTAVLIEDLVTNPPTITIGSTDLVGWVDDVVTELTTFISNLTAVNSSLDNLLGSLAASQQQLSALYMGLLVPDDGMKDILQIMDMYTIVLEHMLQDIDGFLVDPDTGFKDYPEMRKVWDLLEQGPHVMETFIYTSVMDNTKITLFTTLLIEGIDKLCEANPNDLMTVPPDSSFSFADFLNHFCSINMTSFEEEYMRFTKTQNISDTYDSLGTNSSREVNMTALTERMQSLIENVLNMTGNGDSYQLPQFMNVTAWMEALADVSEFLVNNTSWTDLLLAAQEQSISTVLRTLNEMEGLHGLLRIDELYIVVIEQMVKEGKYLLTASDLGLKDYPEMLTVWELMEDLPHVLETFMYTSYMDNLKISRFIEVISEGVDSFCEADPDLLMTDPPGSDFNFTAFFYKFCSINMTALEEEYSNFTNREDINFAWDNIESYNETVDIAVIMEHYDYVLSHLDHLMADGSNFSLPQFLDSAAWDQAFENIMGFYANNTDWIQSLTTTAGLEMIDDIDMARVGLTVDMGLDLMIERLEEISVNLTVETLTRGAPNLVLMMKSVASLNTAMKNTTLQENIDEDKLMSLLMDPDMVLKFCENNSLAEYIRIDVSGSAVATDVQNILCVVLDMEGFVTSLQDQVDYDKMEEKLTAIWNMSNTELTYDWDMMTIKLTTVMELLTNLTTSPPYIDPVISEILDMESILNMLSQMVSSPAFYASVSSALTPWTGDQTVDASGISSVVMYIIELFEKNDWNIPLTALLPDSSTMAFYIQEFLSVDSYQTLMLATLDPEQFWMLVLSGDWESTVCDPDKFARTFTFPEGIDVGQLQTDLCEKSKSQNLNGVFRTIDVADITNQLGQYIANLTSEDSSMDPVLTIESLANYTASLLNKLVNTGNSEPFDLERYLEPIVEALNNLNPSANNILSVCTETTSYLNGTDSYQTVLSDYLQTVYLSLEVSRVYFSIQNELGDVLCDPESRNVSILVMKMKEKGIPDKLQFLAEVYMGKHDMSSSEFTCEGIAALYTNYTDILTESTDVIGGLFNESSKTLACVEDTWSRVEDLLMDMTRLFAQGSQLINILGDQQFRQFIYTILESNQTLEVLDEIVNLYQDQQQSIDSIRDGLQSNVTDLLSSFEENYNIAPDILRAFVNSTFDRDFSNETSEEILDYICNSTRLEEAIEMDSNFENLKDILCGENRETALDTVNSLTQLGNTLNKLEGLPVDSQEFYEVLMRDVSELVGDIQGISELAGIIGNLQDVDIFNLQVDDELLDTIQRTLLDNSPDDLYSSLSAVISNFGDVDGDSSAEVVAELQAITDGLFAFKSLRNLIIRDVKISNLVQDPAALTKYMTDVLGLPTEVAQAITDGSISFKVLLDASQINITQWVCNSTQLAMLIDMSDSATTDVDYISTQFCMLDSDTVTKILEEVLQLVDIGDLMEEYVENSFYNLLSEENLTMNETKQALASVQAAQNDLKALIERADEYTASIPNAVAALSAAQLGSSQTMNSLSSVLCGKEIESLEDDFGIRSSVKSSDEMTESQIQEMNSLPGEHCKDLYREIMSTEEGPIIWAYLKPLLRGKILYAPDTVEMAAIMEQVNSTFSMIEDIVIQAKEWADGSGVFEEVTGESGTSLQEILDSQLVGGVITDIAGMSADDIKDVLYSFNSSDPEFVKGLSSVSKLVADYVGCIEMDRLVPFETEQAMNAEAAHLQTTNDLLAGIVFDFDTTNRRKRDTAANLPKHIKYRIRMDIDNVQHTYRLKERMWRPKPEGGFSNDMRYLRGFIQLQQMIDSAIISTQLGTDIELPLVSTKQFPFPCHKEDTFINAFAAYLLPILMTIAWLAGVSVAVYNLVYDRENGQEETLKAMGLTSSLNWWAWFISTMLISSAIAFINAVILKYWDVFVNSNLLLIFLFFVDFIFSSIMMCYFVSAFFTRTALAILSSLIVYLLSYLPYVILISLEVEMEFYQKFLACLSSTTAFSFGAHFIARFEEQQTGVQWDNADASPLHDDNFSFQWACIMMAIDGAIYLVLGWYVRNVKPGKYGISQSWYFPFDPYYWGCSSKGSSSARGNQDVFSEEVTTDFPVIISMRGLSKKFSGRKVVDNLSLDIHAGHVTALLGHNGAAKTTTMNMLIGILEPSAGEVMIFNRPQNKMRNSIGVCPQHNALFEYMTVKEHMEFYAAMKSAHPGGSYKDEIKELLKDVDLWWCRYARVKELSGGMQRRLCVALAFVGGSRAVILDEPTSGVDPSGRRAIWNLIIKRKTEAAILLSTHHLDEADILGDTIAIMHEGKLLCNGSPMFLKQHLTQGHRLTVIKETSTQGNDPTAILTSLQNWIPETTLAQIVGNEMTFVLPSTNSALFYNLLKDLENNREQLKIDSFGVSDPTLEEVFLKVCKTADVGQIITPYTVKEAETKDDSNGDKEWKHNIEDEGERREHSQKMQRSSGASLKLHQFGGLLAKRFNHYRRNWRVLISVLVLPLLLFLVASGFYYVKPKGVEAPSIYLTPATYGPNTNVFYKGDDMTPLSASIVDSFEKFPGIGTTCMAGFKPKGEQYECVQGQSTYSAVLGMPVQNRTCVCDKSEFKCSGFMTPPRSLVTTTTDILMDLENRDIEKYLIDSFHDFIEKRYGGWSFEQDSQNKLHAKIWFNNKGHHALPSFLNAYSNGLLRAMVNETPSEFGITASTHPYLFSKEQLGENTLLQHAADAGIALTILVAFTFFPVGVMMYVVMENVNKDRHLQSISGVGSVMYWLASILWDMLILIIAVAITFGIVAIFRHDSFWNRENAPATVVLLLLYGWATIPLTYCFVKLFKTVSAAFFTLFCVYNFIGIASVSLIFVMDYFGNSYDEEFNENVDTAKKVLLIFPQYALTGGLLELIANEVKTAIFAKFNTDVYVSPFTFDMLAWNMIVMAGEGIFFLIVTILLEINCNSCSSQTTKSGHSHDACEDVDVGMEKRRIQEGNCPDDILVVRDLYKIYPTRDVYAVSGLSFGVPRGQCFGLLGVNGAGKTTTFKMLTGTIKATQGEAWLLGNSVKNASTFGKTIGYCPQEEALDMYLSVEEILAFHCRLKGIPSEQHNHAIHSVMERLALNSFKDKMVKSCSGGMKRKVSLAVALLGDPPIVLLDEPTTGMDPKAKRLVWDCLLNAKANGQAIVLTSHSLEECDILCDRIGIMVNGEFKCLGSSQHLKDKFGEGYTVTLSVVGLSTVRQSMQELVQKHFPGATIRDQHQNIVQLDIPKHSTNVSDIFGVLEAEKHRYNITYYTVSQTTLDTIFLNFARDQGDGSSTDLDTASSSIESYSDDPKTGASLPTAYFAYQNKMYDTFGDSDMEYKPKLSENKYITPGKEIFVTQL